MIFASAGGWFAGTGTRQPSPFFLLRQSASNKVARPHGSPQRRIRAPRGGQQPGLHQGPADRCACIEVEDDQDAVTVRYERFDPVGSNRSLVGRYRLSDFGEQLLPTLRAGKTVTVGHFGADPRFTDAKEAMEAIGITVLVNVPLVKAGRLVAVLAVHERYFHRWTPDEVVLIEAVTERSWGEVERSRATRALTFGRHHLELIFRASPAAMATWRGKDLVFYPVQLGVPGCFPWPAVGRPAASGILP